MRSVRPISKEFREQLEILGFHIAGDGLRVVTGSDDNGSGEFEPAMRQVNGEHIAAVLGVEIVGFALPGDRSMGLGVQLYRIELVAQILGDLFVGIGFPVHLAAPAAPGGIKIDQDGFLLLLQFACGLFDGHPGDGGDGGGFGSICRRQGFARTDEERTDAG